MSSHSNFDEDFETLVKPADSSEDSASTKYKLPTPHHSTEPKLNPAASPFQPSVGEPAKQEFSHASRSPSLHEILERQTQLTELLALQHLQSLLPPIALTKFNGDPTEYSTFLGGFESEIEKRTVSNEARLRYLDQYLEGEPKELIKGCMYKDANVGYPEAKSLLKEKYGDKYKISQAYTKKISDWPDVKSGDNLALDRFSIFLATCYSATASLPHLTLDHPQNLQNLVKKLPVYLQNSWRRKVEKIKVKEQSLPLLSDFVDFVKCEARIANDSLFSRESLDNVRICKTSNPKPADLKKEFKSSQV